MYLYISLLLQKVEGDHWYDKRKQLGPDGFTFMTLQMFSLSFHQSCFRAQAHESNSSSCGRLNVIKFPKKMYLINYKNEKKVSI